MVKGKDLTLYVEISGVLTPVKFAKDCQLTLTADSIETTTQGSFNWKSYDYTRNSATLQHSGLTSFKADQHTIVFLKAIVNRTKLFFSFSDFNNQGVVFSGSCIVSQADMTSPFDNVSEFTASLVVDGPLLITETPIITTLHLADEYGFKPTYCTTGSGTLFPVGVYNVNNIYLGSAANSAGVVSLWNSDSANQDYGVLSATAAPCYYTLTSPYNEDSLPTYIIVDVTNFIPTYGAAITPDQTITLPTNSGMLTYSLSQSGVSLTSHSWSFLTGPNTPTLNTSTGAYSGLIVGVYQFVLTIHFVDGHFSTYIENVTVNPALLGTSLIQWGYSATDLHASVVGGTNPTFQFHTSQASALTPFTLPFSNSAQNMYIYIAMPSGDNPLVSWENTGINNGSFVNDSVFYNVFTVNGLQFNMSRIPVQFNSSTNNLVLNK